MNLETPMTLLTFCLLAATLLGAVMGASLWHLRLGGRQRRALETLREGGERERDAFEALVAQEREKHALRQHEDRLEIARERERAERAVARHDALLVRAREGARRVERLQGEMLALEERHLELQRELAGARATIGSRKVGGAWSGHAGVPGDEERSMLGRRARRHAGSASASFPIGGDLDIPTLDESELPDAAEADDVAFELLDTGNLFPDTDD